MHGWLGLVRTIDVEVGTIEDLIDYLWPEERSRRLAEASVKVKISQAKTIDIQPSEVLTLKIEKQETLF